LYSCTYDNVLVAERYIMIDFKKQAMSILKCVWRCGHNS